MRSVVVTESTLRALVNRPDAVEKIPMLKMFAQASRPKHDCCGRGSSYRQTARDSRYRIVGLPAAQKAYLKKILNADELVVYIPSPNGLRKVTL